jgi:glutamyl-tRNA synthetase
VEFEAKGIEKYFNTINLSGKLSIILADLSLLEEWSALPLEKIIRQRAELWDIPAGKIIGALRLILTGVTVSPGIFDLMEVLGKERVLRRIGFAQKYIAQR